MAGRDRPDSPHGHPAPGGETARCSHRVRPAAHHSTARHGTAHSRSLPGRARSPFPPQPRTLTAGRRRPSQRRSRSLAASRRLKGAPGAGRLPQQRCQAPPIRRSSQSAPRRGDEAPPPGVCPAPAAGAAARAPLSEPCPCPCPRWP